MPKDVAQVVVDLRHSGIEPGRFLAMRQGLLARPEFRTRLAQVRMGEGVARLQLRGTTEQ